MASIQIIGAVKYYEDGTRDLSDFTIEIADCSLTALAGLKGSGKSALSNILAGLEKLDEGEIRFDGERVNEKPPEERRVALVLRHQTLYPGKTVYENLQMSLRLCETKTSLIPKKISRVAKAMDIESLLPRLPGELSEEEKLTALIARAAVREPGVLIVDHPLPLSEGGDPDRYPALLYDAHEKLKLTMLVPTDDRYLAGHFPGRVVLLHGGAVRQAGAASFLLNHPDNLFVASFLTLPQLSLCTGAVDFSEGRYWLKLGGRKIPLPDGEGLKKYEGKEVLAGIRPKAVRFDAPEAPYTAVVERLENSPYGELATLAGEDFSLTVPNDFGVLEGEKLNFALSGEELWLFDKETEKRVL